ncbi:diaminobutyrate acetyltransferase [Pseudogracilibacillus auburnensis]|uniref:diaminobutyrate acetyltransferase n=1 Tax=Pseudogracilibacillus auburnensis TaxID=1494959 RepID=UPI0027D9DD9F|nr:diaminobutyrate acetyltransferase [Pseudogracilibacillus auburnensis]
MFFREPTEDDGSEMFRIVKESKVLDVNSSYSYLMWSKYFNKTSIIAQCEKEEVIGFVSGFLQPESPNTLFIWQVAVDEKHRGKGLATKLIDQLLRQLEEENVRFLEATVTPTNIPSSKLFKGIAKKRETNCAIFECFSEDQFPDPSHEAELTYRIGPLK